VQRLGAGAGLLGAPSEELVLRFVARFGEEALPELDGDFSFVLWTPAAHRLVAYRDLTGSRPFFYSLRGGRIAFSNTLQALLAGGDVRRGAYDPDFLGNFLLGAPHREPERTVYADIRRLPAGHLLEFVQEGFAVRRIAHLRVEEPLA